MKHPVPVSPRGWGWSALGGTIQTWRRERGRGEGERKRKNMSWDFPVAVHNARGRAKPS